MKYFPLYCLLISLFSAVNVAVSQVTYNLPFTPANLFTSPLPPIQGGMYPASNFTAVAQPLLVENSASNAQIVPNTSAFYAPAGNVNNVYFAGDQPSGGTGQACSSIFFTQTFSSADFPISLKANFFNRQDIGPYNESYLWIGPANYVHYNSGFTSIPSNVVREGVYVGKKPFETNIINALSTTQTSTPYINNTHNIAANNQWYELECVFDIATNGHLEVRETQINGAQAYTNNFVVPQTTSWTNNFRVAICPDDMAEGVTLTSKYVSIDQLQIIPSSVNICAGECITLNATAQNQSISSPNTNFTWTINGSSTSTANGSIVSNVCFPNAGTFPIEVEASNQYDTITETIIITVSPGPQVDLGNDSILCGDQFNLTLNANSPGSTFLWSTGSNSSTIQPNITSDQLFWVEIDSNGCIAKDSIFFEVNPVPSLNIGNDTTLCSNQIKLTLNADVVNADSYLWFDGSTLPSLIFTPFSTTTAWLEITEDGCSATDSLLITIEVDSNIQPINDTMVCNTVNQLTFDAFAQGATYLWSDGSTNSTITTPLSSDTSLWVDIDINGCVYRDSIAILYLLPPEVVIYGDSLLCPDENISLYAESNTLTSFLWSNGAINDTISIASEGTYSVTAENICGTDQDSFDVQGYTPVSLDFLPFDTVICNDKELFWDFNATDLSVLEDDGSISNEIYIFEPGTYIYKVFDLCTSTKRVVNVNLCDCEIFIPNTFTPNSDYLNEMFTPVLTCEPWKYRFDIWNRWGEMIFTTEIYGKKWNGQFQGADCSDGVYYYTVMYQYLPGYDRKKYSGAVNLLR